MYYVYILQNLKGNIYYIGQTNNLEERLIRHNEGRVRGSRNWRPWEIVYSEEYKTRGEAMKREIQLKKWKNHGMLSNLISRGGGTVTSEAS